MRLREGASGFAVAVAAAFLSAAAPAHAAQQVFVVNSNSSAPDAGINGDCDTDPTADDDCTLAAAIAEANAHAEGAAGVRDAITFSTTNSGTDPDDVAFVPATSNSDVTINGPFPPITDGVIIQTANCASLAGLEAAPCAVLAAGLDVEAVGEVRISGFAFTGTAVGVHVVEIVDESPSIPDFKLDNAFFGVEKTGVKGSAVPPGTGVLLEDVDGAEIGGETVFEENLFARQVTAIDIFGADNTRILGNEFGVLADGSFARAGEGGSNNGDNIEITGDNNGSGQTVDDDQAIGTQVGARSASDASTPACDGFCNLITRAGISATNVPQARAGIDLNGEGADDELPARETVIRGNVIGGGGGINGRNAIGINVGGADETTVGGPGAAGADRNVLAGNEIVAGAGATDLLIEGNFVGLNQTGNGIEPNSDAPILALAGSGTVRGNRLSNGAAPHPVIRLSGTSAPGFDVAGNVFGELVNGNAATAGTQAIDVTGNGHTIGGTGPGDANLFSNFSPVEPSSVGVRLAGDDNDVLGNRFGVGSGGQARPLAAGITLEGDADGNRVGGDVAAAENVISNSADDAIRVTGANSDGNLIARNRGSGNGGLFIDLGNDGPGNLAEPDGPNGGAQAPAITAATATSAQGSAVPGAVIRLFTKSTAAPGELAGFLAQAVADGSGSWQASFAEQPAGTLLAATATAGTGTSELSSPAIVPVPPPGDDGGGAGAGGGAGDGAGGGAGDGASDGGGNAADTDPPETTIVKRPKNRIEKPTAKYTFRSDEPGSTFRCKLDRKKPKPCTSPRKLKKLDDGKHRFQVFAIDAAGNADPTAAKDSFKVDTN